MIRIAVVGDVHDQWQAGDALALGHLSVDLVLFVGDFGNESLAVVQQVAALPLPKAVVLGNHDAWYTATDWGRRKCPYDRQTEDRFQAQLEVLADLHVGYGGREFPNLDVTVVGGRPCSWGGGEWKLGEFYQQYFGVGGWAESQARITQAIRQARSRRVILLNHNGPTGLGEAPQAPCGRDWHPVGGDYGDPDLRGAIQHAQQEGIPIPLVVFGHMHRQLRGNLGQRQMWQRDETGTVYFNAAVVPRIHTIGGESWHHFGLVELGTQGVQSLAQVWVHPATGRVEPEWLLQPPGLGRHEGEIIPPTYPATAPPALSPDPGCAETYPIPPPPGPPTANRRNSPG